MTHLFLRFSWRSSDGHPIPIFSSCSLPINEADKKKRLTLVEQIYQGIKCKM